MGAFNAGREHAPRNANNSNDFVIFDLSFEHFERKEGTRFVVFTAPNVAAHENDGIDATPRLEKRGSEHGTDQSTHGADVAAGILGRERFVAGQDAHQLRVAQRQEHVVGRVRLLFEIRAGCVLVRPHESRSNPGRVAVFSLPHDFQHARVDPVHARLDETSPVDNFIDPMVVVPRQE